jgi:L-gulonate 5-dehydrogenase
MKAAVTLSPEHMELRDVPEVRAGAGQALLAVCAVGLCGSDVHLFKGTHPYSRFPTVQGHEFSGVVEALGEGYEGPLRIGDLVAVEPSRTCGYCVACRRGHRNCCVNVATMGAHVDGALADHVAVAAASCYRVGPLGYETAALVEPVSIGLQAVVRSGATSADRLLVIGAGPVGQAIVLAARDRGATIMAADLLDNRLALAAAMGADLTVNTSRQDLTAAVADWTEGEGPTVVVEATGVPGLVRAAVDLVAPSGTVVVVGISTEEVALPVALFTRKEINLVGSRNNNGLFGSAVDLVQRNEELVASWITHRFPFAEAPDAVRFAMTHASEAEKVLVVVNGQNRSVV